MRLRPFQLARFLSKVASKAQVRAGDEQLVTSRGRFGQEGLFPLYLKVTTTKIVQDASATVVCTLGSPINVL